MGVLAIDDVLEHEEHVVSKRLYEVDFDVVYLGFVAYTVDGQDAETFVIEGGHAAAASDRLSQARALSAASTDDSQDEPPDFDVPGDDFGS